MHSRLIRVIALVILLGSTLVSPVGAQAQPTVVLLTLADGTACRGPITGTTFNLVDQRANYACTDGRWILGEPFSLGDGRQVAMLGRTILQGQRVSDDSDPCDQLTCVVGLGIVEVSTSASLPPTVYIYRANGGSSTCTFQDGATFYLGTTRANYLCDPILWSKSKDSRHDVEFWIVGGPMFLDGGPGFRTVFLASVVRQSTPLGTWQGSPVCDKPVCILGIQQEDLTP
jgi:hypothetical protein